MSLFTKNQQNYQAQEKTVSSYYGRNITSVNTAKKELFFKPKRVDPLPRLRLTEDYLGEIHSPNETKPLYIPTDDITMQILVGSTGTGKGVQLGVKAAEQIRRGGGMIIIDPKQDDFLPQVVKEELAKAGRADDLLIASWPHNFGYMGLNDDDTYQDVANKIIDVLGIEPSDNPGVEYYRRLERVMLKKVLKLFFNGGLGEIVEKDLNAIARAIIQLKDDLSKKERYEEESAKNKPNVNLLTKLEKRYFDPAKLELIDWTSKDIDTLESLALSLDELCSAGTIFKKHTVDEVLYKNKVLYLKIDMLDVASLKMAKMVIADAIQRARAKLPTKPVRILADEISFYANFRLASGLATTRGFHLNFILALQDLAQIEDGLREAILSNCNLKLFYKISDEKTLNYVEKIGGQELVTQITKNESDESIRQGQEPLLNVTRLRALPRAGVAVVVAEALNTPVIVQTNFVEVSGKFAWSKYEQKEKPKYGQVEKRDLKIENVEELQKRREKYRQKILGVKSLTDGLEGILYDYEAL